jgi:signal transduction histidine kinase/DNA-binding response OmpR family regulator
MTDVPSSILIVDDRPEKLLALEAVLEDLGTRIVRAESGRDALRAVLNDDFAVILLDVNMPGLDGFETAQLIRQRPASRHIPIIFLTAFGDDIHMTQGYKLGAVDYIQTPFVPDVLKTKVSVFVDVFRKSVQVKQQAEALRRRAEQLQKLAAASVVINGANSAPRMLQSVTDTARDVIGSHQAITLVLGQSAGTSHTRTEAFTSYSDRYADWRNQPLRLEEVADTIVARSHLPTRLTEAELTQHPDWEVVKKLKMPPVKVGMMAAPLRGRDGQSLGVIYLCERADGAQFTADDEAILVQLSQMASTAIENILFSQEREANRLKDEFLATLSHELRTPLNAILGWAQLLKMEGLEGNAAHGIEVIERNAKAQTKLIEDLLEVSRITTGKLRLSVKRIELAPVVRAAVDAVRPAADAKQITLDLHLPDEPSPVTGDPDRLQQVVWNLLTNAVKFTPANGRVIVEMLPLASHIDVRVTDTGPGISREFLPYVFDRFRQADSTSTRMHGGLGIGLTIVRHIVELHGGSVRADSAGQGQGATFTVTLPAAHGPAAVVEELPSQNGQVLEAPTGPMEDLDGVRVLLVDDERDARDVVSEVLRRRHAEVQAAANVQEAIERLASFRPTVLVSDIAMPDADGYELIRRVRALSPEQGGRIPAIALTAYARPDDRDQMLASGFQAHLAKPVEPHELVASVAQIAAAATVTT